MDDDVLPGGSYACEIGLYLLLACLVGAAWFVVFEFSLIPAHSRSPLEVQAVPLK